VPDLVAWLHDDIERRRRRVWPGTCDQPLGPGVPCQPLHGLDLSAQAIESAWAEAAAMDLANATFEVLDSTALARSRRRRCWLDIRTGRSGDGPRQSDDLIAVLGSRA
jgi:hypothetical protein